MSYTHTNRLVSQDIQVHTHIPKSTSAKGGYQNDQVKREGRRRGVRVEKDREIKPLKSALQNH